MQSQLQPGLTGEATATVTELNIASAMRSGDVPAFATPAMVALMEEAAVNALNDCLEPEKTTVGVRIDVRHLAATPLGVNVRAQARLVSLEGRRLTFRMTAHDDVEQIGEGVHERMIVDRAKFIDRTGSKRRG